MLETKNRLPVGIDDSIIKKKPRYIMTYANGNVYKNIIFSNIPNS